MHNLFIAARYDTKNQLIHGTAILTSDDQKRIGRMTISQYGGPNADEYAAGLMAFETGVLMAKQAGCSKLLLHAPDDIDAAVMFQGRENKDIVVDSDGGIDYFDMGVYIYRPGSEQDGYTPELWQQANMAKAEAITKAAYNDHANRGL